MNRRLRYLTADIAFAAILVLCVALSMLAFSYQVDTEVKLQSKIHLSIAERDTVYISRDQGQLLEDISSDLATMLDTASQRPIQADSLQQALRNAPYLRALSLIDPQGKVTASTSPDDVGHTFVDLNAYLVHPLSNGDLLRIGPTYAGRALVDAVPLTDNAKPTPRSGFIPLVYTRLAHGKEPDISLVAALNLEYLRDKITGTLGMPNPRIALLRTDGLRLFDTEQPDAGLMVIERRIAENWSNDKPVDAMELQAVDGQRWIVSYRLNPYLPIGTIWAANLDKMLEDASNKAQRNNMTVMLLMIAGMICVLFGYLFFRYANRHERERLSKIEAQRRLLENTLNACANAIAITSPSGIIEWINPAYTTLTGYTSDEAIGRNPRELSKSGVQGSAFYANMWQTICAGRVWHGELVNRRKDGSLYDELLTISPALDSDGTIQHFIATKVDCTEHKAAREELEIAHSHLNSVVENFPGALVMEDTAGRIVLLNQNVFELLGLPGSNDYVLGRPVHPLMVFSSHAAEDSQAFMERVDDLRAGGHPIYGDEIQFKDGRWIERDFIPIYLHDKLIGFLYIYRDISQRKRHQRELWQLATSDPLTGIPNRRTFFEHIERERARLARYPSEAAILMMDIDHFKQINDTHGHAVGDAMLIHIVRQVRKLLRESDIMARLGGEEFAVLLPQASRDGAFGLAERVRKVLEDNPLIYDNQPIYVTTSVGLTIMTAVDLNTDQALSRADHALYEAKRKGRNRVEIG